MNLFARIEDFFHLPDPRHDARCAEHGQWVDDYEATEMAAHELVFDLAREKYRQFAEASRTLEAKAEGVVRTSGLIATILVASIAALDLPLTWPIAVAVFFLLLAMLIALWCRHPLAHPAPPTIRDILTHGEDLELPVVHTWLAAAIHRSAEQYRLVVDWKANRLREAIAFLSLGLFVLILTAGVVAVWPR